MWRISNKEKGRSIEKVEGTKRGFVDLSTKRKYKSNLFRPANKSDQDWQPSLPLLILLYSPFLVLEKNWIFNSCDSCEGLSLFALSLLFSSPFVQILQRIVSKCLFNSRNSNKCVEFVLNFFFIDLMIL